MSTSTKMIFITIGMFFMCSASSFESKNDKTISVKPVYFMAQLKIIDKDKFFSQYVPEVKKHIAAGNGEVLFGGVKPLMQLEGSWDYFTIVIKFPSKNDFDKFYFSKGNLDIAVPIRQQSSSVNNLMLFG